MDDLRIETCWSNFKCFNVKCDISALVGVIIKLVQYILKLDCCNGPKLIWTVEVKKKKIRQEVIKVVLLNWNMFPPPPFFGGGLN